jgi:hypothetical protein
VIPEGTRLYLENVILDDERQEIAQHFFRHVEVGNDAVLHGTNGNHSFGCAAEHALGLEAHAFDLLRLAIQRDDRWLVKHDALALNVDQRVRSAEIYGNRVSWEKRCCLEGPAHCVPGLLVQE